MQYLNEQISDKQAKMQTSRLTASKLVGVANETPAQKKTR